LGFTTTTEQKERGAIDEFVARTIDQVARFFRVNRRTVAEWRAEGCPGSRGAYPLSEVVQWLKEHKWTRPGAPDPEVADPLMGGANTPALERYREAAAQLKELDYQERIGVLVSRDRIHDGLLRCGGVLRSAMENLQREFGPEAVAIMDDALDDFEREVEQEFGDLGDAEGQSADS